MSREVCHVNAKEVCIGVQARAGGDANRLGVESAITNISDMRNALRNVI
jgi:hypothetical protein